MKDEERRKFMDRNLSSNAVTDCQFRVVDDSQSHPEPGDILTVAAFVGSFKTTFGVNFCYGTRSNWATTASTSAWRFP